MKYCRFSVVTSVSIIDFQRDIQKISLRHPRPRSERQRHRLRRPRRLLLLIWKFSDPTYVSVQCTMCANFHGVGSGWLFRRARKAVAQDDRIEMRGTLTQRNRHRHRKMNRMAAWRFDVTMEALPTMFQIVPLASCYELLRSPWNVNQTIAVVTIATPSLGFLFYISIVSSFGYLFIMTFSKTGGIGDELAYSGRSGAAAGSAS